MEARAAHHARRRRQREEADALLEELNASYAAAIREAEARGGLSGESRRLSSEVEAAWEEAERRRMSVHLAASSIHTRDVFARLKRLWA